MAVVFTEDGIRLHVEEAGSGVPVVFRAQNLRATTGRGSRR